MSFCRARPSSKLHSTGIPALENSSHFQDQLQTISKCMLSRHWGAVSASEVIFSKGQRITEFVTAQNAGTISFESAIIWKCSTCK
jgi:hypothetical protein